MAHHGRGIETQIPGKMNITGVIIGDERDELESLREGFKEYKEKCELNKKHLKERYSERKIRETNNLGERYEEKKKQSEENKQRLKERYEERKSRKEVE